MHPRSDTFAIAALLIFALALGHLVVDPRAIDVSGAPRLLAFALVMGAFLAWALRARRYESWDFSVLSDPVVLSFSAYAAVSVWSALFAINPAAGASDMAATAASLILLCLVASLLRTRSDLWPLALKIFAATAALFAGLAWIETWGKWGWGIHPRVEMERVEGTMYNGNLHASFLALLFPLAACGTIVLRGAWRCLAGFSLFLLGSIVLLMQTRAVYVALCAAVILAVVLACIYPQALGLSHRGRSAVFGFAVLASAAVLLFVFLQPDNPVASRVRSLTVISPDSTAAMRLFVWAATWRMALDHILTGVGAGNFAIHFHRYYNSSDPQVATWNPNWLHPHNDYLFVLAEKGIPGALCLLAVLLFAALHLVRAVRRASATADAIISLCVLGGLLTYAVIAFFDFPMARPGHLFFLAFYLGASVALNPSDCSPHAVPRLPVSRRAILNLGIVLCLLAAFQAFLTLRQEWFVKMAWRDIAARDWEGAVSHARHARLALNQLDPLGVPVVFHEALGHLMSGRQEDAMECFLIAASENPYCDKVQRNLAALYSAQSRDDLALTPPRGISGPRRHDPSALFYLAQTCLRSGDYAEALNILRRLPPEFEPARVRALREEAENLSGAGPAEPPTADANDG